MALSTKIIRRRIKSISNTKKITKAMEMISAVKMRRAVANTLASRSYATLAWEMLLSVASKTHLKRHPLLARRPVKNIGIIFITSNRGLAGGFNSKLLQEVNRYIKRMKTEHGATAEVMLLGKKGRKIYQNFGHTIAAEFEKLDVTTKIDQILPMAALMSQEYITKKYDLIAVAYTDFVSALQQIPKIKELLPLSTLSGIPPLQGEGQWEGSDTGLTFEPNPDKVLEVLLPRLIEMQLYQAVLESDASEHSARMVAMRSATDAAKDMIKDLQTSFNNARQAGITKEIAEVIGGAAALE